MGEIVLSVEVLRRAARAPGSSSFPFLAPFARKPKPGCCGNREKAPDPRPVYEAILAMPVDRRNMFKSMLKADTLSVWVVRAAKTVKLSV